MEVGMRQKKPKDLLIRNVPIEVYALLEESAKEHNRSKTQEAIVALTTGLSICSNKIKQPKPFKWRKQITREFIQEIIDEGRP
jgi:hypothetical protein